MYVQDGDKVKVVRFGDPNLSIKRDDPNRRKNFEQDTTVTIPVQKPKQDTGHASSGEQSIVAKVDN